MRAMKKNAKRCLAAFVAVILVGGVTVSFPLRALAERLNFVTDNGTIPDDGNEYRNSASDVTNNGTVYTNSGSITDNNSTVRINFATITNNNVTVESNLGGHIVNNYGVVEGNGENGGENGIVENNFGSVGSRIGNGCEVTNNYGGRVTNLQTGYVKNQFYSISVTGPDDTDVTYDTGITDPIVSDAQGNEKRYIQVTNNQVAIDNISGTVTIATDADHEITGDDKNVETEDITYTLVRQDNGTYVITITAIGANVALTNTDLGLTVQAIQQQIPDVGPDNVIIRVDSSVQITDEDETGSNRAVSDTAPTTGNAVTAAQISAMIESALAANPGATVLDLDLGNDPSFTADTLIALCEKSSVAKNCHFTHNGMKFVLFIPVVDPTSAAYQQCKALLDAEEGNQAGPIRLSYLFAPVKFKLSQE